MPGNQLAEIDNFQLPNVQGRKLATLDHAGTFFSDGILFICISDSPDGVRAGRGTTGHRIDV